MTVSLSIKGVPADLAARLRQRAARNHRSLQRELMALLEAAAAVHPLPAIANAGVPSPLQAGADDLLSELELDFDSREAELRLARAGRLPGAD